MTVCVCASTITCAIPIPSLGCPHKRLPWKSPAVDVIVLWLFPYLGRFNILFYCLACQQLWPRYLPFPVIQECSGPFKPKHSLCLYHQPRETLGLLIHLRIILKQITFNRQGQGTMKICDPLRSSVAMLNVMSWASSRAFYRAHIRVGRWSGCYWMCVWPAKSVDWTMEPNAVGEGETLLKSRSCWAAALSTLNFTSF